MKLSLKSILTISVISISFSSFSQDVKVVTNIPAEAEAGKEFPVEITINKGDVAGFAKLQQDLPIGFTAVPDNPNGSTFSFKEQKVKFLWMALPADKTFKVSYKVKVDASVTGNQILEGTFSFILNNETQKAALPKDIINITASGTAAAVAQNSQPTKAKTVEPTKINSAEPAKTEPVVTASEPVKTETATASNNNAEVEAKKAAAAAEAQAKKEDAQRKKDEAAAAKLAAKAERDAAAAASSASKSTASAGGLIYKVQVAATKRKAEPSEFKTAYNLSETVNWEEHEGLNKYVVGGFGSYKAAKNFSNSIRDNNAVPGPFVTAYKDGARITVQEALGIQGR